MKRILYDDFSILKNYFLAFFEKPLPAIHEYPLLKEGDGHYLAPCFASLNNIFAQMFILGPEMGLQLRITYENKDQFFELLTEKPSAGSAEIDILLGGQAYRLRRQDKGWAVENEEHGPNADLFQAIGKTIELRYRL